MERMEALRRKGKGSGVEAFLVTSEKNTRHLAGFSTLAIERFAGVVIPVESGLPTVIVPKLEETKVREKSARA
jgi:Xaa-Pro aminopeptidase